MAVAQATDDTAKYPFDEGFQDKILAAVLRDVGFARAYVETVRATYFTTRLQSLVSATACGVIARHNVAPSRETLIEELREAKALDEEARRYVARLYDEVKLEDVAAVRERAIAFGRRRAVFMALSTATIKLEDEDANGVPTEETVQAALVAVEKSGNFGRTCAEERVAIVADINRVVSALYADEEDRISLAISGLDAVTGGGMKRGNIVAVTGTTGGAKSSMLTNVAINGALRGMLVAIATLELRRIDVATRALCRLMCLTERELRAYAGDVWSRLERLRVNGGDVVIQAFPAVETNVATLRSFVSQVQEAHGRPVDLLIVDPSENVGVREEKGLDKAWERQRMSMSEMTSWARVGQLPTVLTAMQLTVDAALEPYDLVPADVKGQERTHDLDLLIGIEKLKPGEATTAADDHARPGTGVRNLRVMKSRLGPEGVVVPVRIDLARYLITDHMPPDITVPAPTPLHQAMGYSLHDPSGVAH